jgi:hypothetical protein
MQSTCGAAGALRAWGFMVSRVPKCEEPPPHGRRPVRGNPGPGAPGTALALDEMLNRLRAQHSGYILLPPEKQNGYHGLKDNAYSGCRHMAVLYGEPIM